MPAITKTTIGNGANAVTETTLDGTDSFTYSASGREILTLRNPTAAPIAPVIDGDRATTLTVGGVGAIDLSGGYSVGSIAADAVVAIPLDFDPALPGRNHLDCPSS